MSTYYVDLETHGGVLDYEKGPFPYANAEQQ